MAWIDEAALPFTPTGQIFFSPIVDGVVYIIDQDTNFYKYNIATNTYTLLTSPTYGSSAAGRPFLYRTLAVSPDGLRIACCSDGYFMTSGIYKTGGSRRIEIYTIATNTWVASSTLPRLTGAGDKFGVARSIVWETDDKIWIWAVKLNGTASGWQGKCIYWVPSTDTFTQFTAFSSFAGLSGNFGNGGAAIKADNSVVYGGGTKTAYGWERYTVATDAYINVSLSPLSDRFAHAYDKDKVWYYEAGGTCQQGYVDVEDNSQNDDQFEENTDRDAGYGKYCGIKDDLSLIIAHARAAAPELMSLTVAPVVTFIPRIMMF